MHDELADIRHQLEILCRRKKSRTSEFRTDRPTEWRPSSVVNPEDGRPFTDAGAWEFVADNLAMGVPIKPKALEFPMGKTGYEMVIALGDRELYVKLQLGPGSVIGRSFHYSKSGHSDSGNVESRRERGNA